jgi:outer membrane usher protein FimD/PapC
MAAALLFLQPIDGRAQGAPNGRPAAAAIASPGLPALAFATVNGIPSGNVEFYVGPGGQAIIPSEVLRAILGKVVKAALLDKAAGGKQYATRESLEGIGVRLEYDETALRLDFTVPPIAMIPSDLGALPPDPRSAEGSLFPNEESSSMLSVSGRIAPSFGSGGAGEFAVSAELRVSQALRLGGFVIETGMEALYPELPWIRLPLALVSYDFPGIGARASLGTLAPRAVSFQSPVAIIGLRFARETSLPGGKTRRPSPIRDILLDHPADVSVEINGIVARALRLPAGSFRLSELPLATGFNTLAIRIREEGMPPRTIELGLPFDLAILPPGQLDYSMEAGLDRASLSLPFASAYVSAGVASMLELGIDACASGDAFLGGANALWAGPIGGMQASFSAGMPFGRIEAAGCAGRLGWRLAINGFPLVPRLGAEAEYRSAGFIPPGDGSEAGASIGESLTLSFQASQNFPKGIGSVGAYGTMSLCEGSLEGYSISSGLFFTLPGSAALSASGGIDWRRGAGFEARASLTLSVSSGDSGNMQFSQDIAAGGQSFGISVPLDKLNATRLSVQGETPAGSASGPRRGAIMADYSGEKAVLSLSGSIVGDGQGGQTRADFSLSGSSSLEWAGGHFGFSGRPGNAFVFLVPDPGLGADQIVMSSRDGPSVKSAGGRDALMAGLIPYSPFIADLSMPGSPPGFQPLPRTVRIEPAYKSGTIVRVRAAPRLAFRGRLVDAKGKILANLSGDIYGAKDPQPRIGASFSDEKGIFEYYGLEPGSYLIRWSDGRTSMVEVIDQGLDLNQLGNVPAAPPPEGAPE